MEKWRINTVERLCIARSTISWIEQLNYYDSHFVLQSHMTVAKLACKTGNLQIAKYHLNKMEEIKKAEQVATFSNYPQNPYVNNIFTASGAPVFTAQPFIQGFPITPAFAVMPPGLPTLQLSPTLPTVLPLEMVIQTSKIARLSKNNKDDGTAFFTLANAISIQDVAMCSPSM